MMVDVFASQIIEHMVQDGRRHGPLQSEWARRAGTAPEDSGRDMEVSTRRTKRDPLDRTISLGGPEGEASPTRKRRARRP